MQGQALRCRNRRQSDKCPSVTAYLLILTSFSTFSVSCCLFLSRMSSLFGRVRGCRSAFGLLCLPRQSNARALATSRPQLRQPISVAASSSERTRGKLSDQNLEKAVRQVHHDGIVIVQDAIETELLDKLNDRMVADALSLRSRGKDSPFNYNQGNLQQDAPPVKEFFYPQIFLSQSRRASPRFPS
jgi:hypothetical protein